MPIGAVIIAKEAAKKTIKETVKQIAKETKKDVLKGKLEQAVKTEAKEEIKGKVVEEIDDNIVDVGSISKASNIAKGEGVKGKLSQAVKGEVKERVADDINENIVDTGMVQKGKVVFEATKTPRESPDKAKTPNESEKQTDKSDAADKNAQGNNTDGIKNNIEAEKTDVSIRNSSEQKGDNIEKRESPEGTADVNKDEENKSDKQDTSEKEEKSEKFEPNSYVKIDGERYRTDDNGNIYQKRNPETGVYEGIPNTSYDLNGYHYETDSKGRIKKAGGILQEKNHDGRPTINDAVDGMQENDEKGHLIGDQFNGSNLNGNLVAMDFDVNRSDYKMLEEKLSKCVNEEHKTVEYSIEPKYEGDSNRPTKFVVKYTIDGETFKETFKN